MLISSGFCLEKNPWSYDNQDTESVSLAINEACLDFLNLTLLCDLTGTTLPLFSLRIRLSMMFPGICIREVL